LTKHPKILFSSPCGPYPKYKPEDDPIDFFYYRNTLKQSIFQLRSFQSWHSLHFIAQNIAVPSVVLENPFFERFKKEVKTNDYDIIAIGFTIILSENVLQMIKWIKENYPHIIIVLGGYGTAIFKEELNISKELRSYTDHICFGEGVSFFNELILKLWQINNYKRLSQHFIPSRNNLFRTPITLFRQIVVVAGLGCSNMCSFCATSSQFNGRHISLFKPAELFNSIESLSALYPDIKSVVVYDEDFLKNKQYVLQFIELFKNSNLSRKPLWLTVFSSVSTVNNYTIEELIECGIGTIFIGVESMNKDVLHIEKLSKRQGDAIALFEKLHNHGINTLGSLIFGWDSQNKQTLLDDAQDFVSLNPTFYQIVPLHLVPGTSLWDKMKNENRIVLDSHTVSAGINKLNFLTKNYSNKEVLNIVNSTYKKLVDEGGSWAFKMFYNYLNSFLQLKNSHNNSFIKRSSQCKKMLFPLSILAALSGFFFFGKGFRKKWRKSMKDFLFNFPHLMLLTILLLPLGCMFLIKAHLFSNMLHHLSKNGDQPDFLRKEYH